LDLGMSKLADNAPECSFVKAKKVRTVVKKVGYTSRTTKFDCITLKNSGIRKTELFDRLKT